jgi:hypothetical protein
MVKIKPKNNTSYSWKEVFSSQLVQKLIKEIFRDSPIEVASRESSRTIKLQEEPDGEIRRIIVLFPHGTTAGEYSGELQEHELFNPYPEALEAQVQIKGGVAPGRRGYRKINDVIKFSYFTTRDADVLKKDGLKEELKSSHTAPFRVVKPNGFGFWHSLQNMSDEWVLLIVEKKLVAAKPMQVEEILEQLDTQKHERVNAVIENIKKQGDHIFEHNVNPLVELSDIDQNVLIHVLIALLNIPEHANHEPCTVVALLLKIAHQNREAVREACQQALEKSLAPRFYLDEILGKIK